MREEQSKVPGHLSQSWWEEGFCDSGLNLGIFYPHLLRLSNISSSTGDSGPNFPSVVAGTVTGCSPKVAPLLTARAPSAPRPAPSTVTPSPDAVSPVPSSGPNSLGHWENRSCWDLSLLPCNVGTGWNKTVYKSPSTSDRLKTPGNLAFPTPFCFP